MIPTPKTSLAVVTFVLLSVLASANMSAQSLAPVVFLGAQSIQPVRCPFRHPGLAVTALALWPVKKRMSVQVQWIQPVQRDLGGPLVRIAWDVCVLRCRP